MSDTGNSPIPSLNALALSLKQILGEMDDYQAALSAKVSAVHPRHRECARNLVDYLAFRADDRSGLQERLSALGLSSLGRSEAAIRAQVTRVLSWVEAGTRSSPDLDEILREDPQQRGRRNLVANSQHLFGQSAANRNTRIMVTMPYEVVDDPQMVEGFLRSGMNVARINCAHDTPSVWRRIAGQIRQASDRLELPCQIMMDLAGPKLRSGPMSEGPRVSKVRPLRDVRGRVTHESRILLHPHTRVVAPDSTVFSVPLLCEHLEQLPEIRRVTLRDARQKHRSLEILSQGEEGILLKSDQTIYFETGNTLTLHTRDKVIEAEIGPLPPRPSFIPLQIGSRLLLVSDGRAASPALTQADGEAIAPATVSCGVPEALDASQLGHEIKLDDGKFTGVVIEKADGSVLLEITEAPLGGGKLRAEKGINFPDTDLPVAGLTTRDLQDLDVVCELADMVALSFVSRAEDVESLRAALEERQSNGMGIILKIETRPAYQRLPELLLAALRSDRVGVMIARGDLAVEAGWREMAEIQDEILWLCAAAHIPTIWATQVLESAAKQGQPTRPEITDAAMAQRAECVMLNKGPYMVKTVQLLNRLLSVMDTHQYKKSARLPALPYARIPRQADSPIPQ